MTSLLIRVVINILTVIQIRNKITEIHIKDLIRTENKKISFVIQLN